MKLRSRASTLADKMLSGRHSGSLDDIKKCPRGWRRRGEAGWRRIRRDDVYSVGQEPSDRVK